MNEFYLTLTMIAVVAVAILAIAFLLTFSPFEKIGKLIKANRRKRAQKNVHRYRPDELYSEKELNTIVLSYLTTRGLYVTKGETK